MGYVAAFYKGNESPLALIITEKYVEVLLFPFWREAEKEEAEKEGKEEKVLISALVKLNLWQDDYKLLSEVFNLKILVWCKISPKMSVKIKCEDYQLIWSWFLIWLLTSVAFIAALRRFISRRGKPKLIWSDHGSNFVGAKNDLKDLYLFLRDQQVEKHVSQFQHIDWPRKHLILEVCGNRPLKAWSTNTRSLHLKNILQFWPKSKHVWTVGLSSLFRLMAMV